MKITFNPNDLTVGDLEDFEDITGKTLEDAFKPRVVRDEVTNKVVIDPKTKRPMTETPMTAKMLLAIVYITGRKTEPNFSVDDARKTKVDELVLVAEDVADPKGEES